MQVLIPLALMRTLIRRRCSVAIYASIPCGSIDGKHFVKLIPTQE